MFMQMIMMMMTKVENSDDSGDGHYMKMLLLMRDAHTSIYLATSNTQ